MMMERTIYLKKLIARKDNKLIKVITGMHGTGQSTLLLQFQDYLRANDIPEKNIIYIDFEDPAYNSLLDYHVLHEEITKRLVPSEMTYIFLDEIQHTDFFERAVASLYLKPNVDIYITGSNAGLLSGEEATLLSGRYVEIDMLPLSFKEFMETRDIDPEKGLAEYLKVGGLPYVATMNPSSDITDDYLEGIYNTVLVKDIEDREKRREKEGKTRRITDLGLLKNISRYLCSVIGSPVSTKSITDYLKSNGRKVTESTIDDYLEVLSEIYLLYPVSRYDIVGKILLTTNGKYYTVDLGLRNHILPRERYDLGFSLENIVYLELKRRGYKVYIGKQGNTEVDFVAEKAGIITYFQVTANMTAEETFEREMRHLKNIKDNYRKIVLTSDRLTVGNYEGIEVINLVDWLLEE